MKCPNCNAEGCHKATVHVTEDDGFDYDLEGVFVYCDDCGVIEDEGHEEKVR